MNKAFTILARRRISTRKATKKKWEQKKESLFSIGIIINKITYMITSINSTHTHKHSVETESDVKCDTLDGFPTTEFGVYGFFFLRFCHLMEDEIRNRNEKTNTLDFWSIWKDCYIQLKYVAFILWGKGRFETKNWKKKKTYPGNEFWYNTCFQLI